MAFYLSTTAASSSLSIIVFPSLNPQFKQPPPSLSLSSPSPRSLQFASCNAAKQQSGPVKKRPPRSSGNKKKNKGSASGDGLNLEDVEIQDDDDSKKSIMRSSQSYQPLPLPKPPAGFVVDDQGRVLMASNKRIATIVDSTNNFPLECIIRRVFRSSRGEDCMLLCPVDTPVQILKSTNIDGWSA